MPNHFTVAQEKKIQRVEMLREMIAEINVQGRPCPLLLSQLGELQVLTSRLGVTLRELCEDPSISETD